MGPHNVPLVMNHMTLNYENVSTLMTIHLVLEKDHSMMLERECFSSTLPWKTESESWQFAPPEGPGKKAARSLQQLD